jgi:hypothetical protein
MDWATGIQFTEVAAIGIFVFTILSRPALGTSQPPMQWLLLAITTGVKRPRPEADYLPQSSAEVKNTLIYSFTAQYVFMTRYLIKQETRLHGMVLRHREKLT